MIFNFNVIFLFQKTCGLCDPAPANPPAKDSAKDRANPPAKDSAKESAKDRARPPATDGGKHHVHGSRHEDRQHVRQHAEAPAEDSAKPPATRNSSPELEWIDKRPPKKSE